VALSASLFAGRHPEALLVVLLGAGGLGLGTQFSALIVHLTNAVADSYAHDISGVTTTTTTIAGAIAIAAFGTAYLSLASAGSATHAFAIVTAGFAAIAGLAGGAGPRRHPACGRQLTSRPARRPRARRRSAKVTRMPSSDTASVIFDSPAIRSLKTKGTSSMRLPMR